MKKKLLAGVVGAALLLGGCGMAPLELDYEGKTHKEDRLEEMIEDNLENENPGYDLEVDVYEEVE